MSMDWRKDDYRVICDFSGFKCWASDTRMVRVNEGDTETSFRVRKDFVDEISQQDIIKSREDNQFVPNARPDNSTDKERTIDITVFGVTGDGSSEDAARMQLAFDSSARNRQVLTVTNMDILTGEKLYASDNLHIRGIGSSSIRKTFKTQGESALLQDYERGRPASSVKLETITFGNPDETVEAGEGKVLNLWGDDLYTNGLTIDKWVKGFAFKVAGNNVVIENYTTSNAGVANGTDGFHVQRGSGVMRGTNVIVSHDDCIGVFANSGDIVNWEFNNITGTSNGAKLFGIGLEDSGDTGSVSSITLNNISGTANNAGGAGILIENQATDPDALVNKITLNDITVDATGCDYGMQIKNVGDITSSNVNISGATINAVQINNTTSNGNDISFTSGSIDGTGCSGRTFEVDGSVSNSDLSLSGVSIIGGSADAIGIDNSGGCLNFNISSCTISNIATNQEGISITSPSTGSVTSNTFTKALGATNTAGIRDTTGGDVIYSGNNFSGVDSDFR